MIVPDWLRWHAAYDDEHSSQHARLQVVRAAIRTVLDERGGRPTRAISACAGEGRDIIDVVAHHPARDSVEALLIEKTPAVAAVARESARRHGLRAFTIVEADAGRSDPYEPGVPADLLLFCGIFGWVTFADIVRTIAFLPSLAAPGATVVWTRHHQPPDLTPAIRSAFAEAGFEERSFVALENAPSSVGVHRLARSPLPFRAGEELFRFAASDEPCR
jgi:hypothetical protein